MAMLQAATEMPDCPTFESCATTATWREMVHVAGEMNREGFKVPLLIADISAAMTLEPGDIIATGTPEGVGAGRSPQEWLWPGDVVEAEVTGIGRLRHPVVAI